MFLKTQSGHDKMENAWNGRFDIHTRTKKKSNVGRRSQSGQTEPYELSTNWLLFVHADCKRQQKIKSLMNFFFSFPDRTSENPRSQP